MTSPASGSGDRDAPSNDKQSNPNNPFIQFRQFADTQISTLLQGIIGLPSALSKRSPDDPRWAGIDDGLRRRDHLQERQRELKESEARKLHRQTLNEEDSDDGIRTRAYVPGGEYVPLGERIGEMIDRPLYSTATEHSFRDFWGRKFNEADWEDLAAPSIWGAKGSYFPKLPPNSQTQETTTQWNMNDLEATHRLVYNELASPTSRLHSDNSLLPYLLFSPYSPLRLSSDEHDPDEHGEPDGFPYADAFEDLIATTHPTSDSAWKYALSKIIGSDMLGPADHVQWIEKLRILGYLQERETRDVGNTTLLGLTIPLLELLQLKRQGQSPLEFMYQFERWAQNLETSSSTQSSRNLTSRKDASNPWIEQEMYDLFLNWTSSPQIIKDSAQAFNAFIASLENDDMSGRKRLDENGASRTPSVLDEIHEITKAFRDWSQNNDGNPEVAQDDKFSEEIQPKSHVHITSSSTKTERTVTEDGTILTSVTVWKKFANGRETSSTTHHSEHPAESASEQRGSDGQSKEELEEAEKSKKNGSPGWFWN